MFSKNNSFKFNKSRLQYWMYSSLAREFGKNIKIKRDPLYRRFDANKHSFSVSHNHKRSFELRNWLEKYLISNGYGVSKTAYILEFSKKNDQGDQWGYCVYETGTQLQVSCFFHQGNF